MSFFGVSGFRVWGLGFWGVGFGVWFRGGMIAGLGLESLSVFFFLRV